MLTDEQLYSSHIHGDRQAFSTLHDRYASALWLAVMRVVRHEHTADDVVQEAFSVAHSKHASFDGVNFRGWLFTIAGRIALTSLRGKRHAAIDDQYDACDLGDSVVLRLESEEARQMVRATMDGMFGHHREIIELYFFEGMTHEQIGLRLGIPPGTSRSRLSKALAQFRTQWQEV
jgi:RNA polymerase sigma factor (sigma-70 family)